MAEGTKRPRLPRAPIGDSTFLQKGRDPPLGFSQVLILKMVKVLCFDILSQVFILNGLLTVGVLPP